MRWHDPKTKITPHFTVGEALHLPKWDVYHRPSPAEANAIMKTALVMERIRKYLSDYLHKDTPIVVTSWMRPAVADIPGHAMDGRNYNNEIGGSPRSAHRFGLACDFKVEGVSADRVRRILLPRLDEWKIRMEDLPGSTWVHVDLMEPRPNRFFKP